MPAAAEKTNWNKAPPAGPDFDTSYRAEIDGVARHEMGGKERPNEAESNPIYEKEAEGNPVYELPHDSRE
jgi:hypothetical protein